MPVATNQGTFLKLFDEQTVDGISEDFEYMHGTKAMNIYVSGGLGGGTLTLEAKNPDGEYLYVGSIKVNGSSGTKGDGTGMYTLESFPYVGRIRLEGSSGASLTVFIQGNVRFLD